MTIVFKIFSFPLKISCVHSGNCKKSPTAHHKKVKIYKRKTRKSINIQIPLALNYPHLQDNTFPYRKLTNPDKQKVISP